MKELPKRERKQPDRFEPYGAGDKHQLQADRTRKSKELKKDRDRKKKEKDGETSGKPDATNKTVDENANTV